MGILWLGLALFGGLIICFFLLGRLTWGSGADLVDWDPAGRNARKRDLELQDMEIMLATINRRRRAQGLPELEEHDVLGGLKRDQEREP
jgi:hypothetical protein